METPPPEVHDHSAKDTQQWTLFIHLAQLLDLVVPLAGVVVPIVLWQTRKEDPIVDAHGKAAANWILTAFVATIALVALAAICFFTLVLAPVGIIAIIAIVIVGLLGVIFPIIAAVKANEGIVWEYPLSFRFFT
ncbi:MAG: DUF4870 domain-containing protein [Planctomycetota bacterium]